MTPLLRFSADGRGKGILWEAVAPRRRPTKRSVLRQISRG
jgi:hypothetical protein